MGNMEMKACELRVPGVMRTLAGNSINLTSFTTDQVNIEDIAWGLGRTLRYGGHIRADYTVANHCIIMSYIVPERYALEALLHDAAEAYLGDIIWPVKALFPDLSAFENSLMVTIMDRFDCPIAATQSVAYGPEYLKSPEVADADIAMMEHECFSLGRPGIYHDDVEQAWLKAAETHEQWWHAPTYAYLERFDQLTDGNSLDLDNLTKLWFPNDDYSDAVVSEVEDMVTRVVEEQQSNG